MIEYGWLCDWCVGISNYYTLLAVTGSGPATLQRFANDSDISSRLRNQRRNYFEGQLPSISSRNTVLGTFYIMSFLYDVLLRCITTTYMYLCLLYIWVFFNLLFVTVNKNFKKSLVHINLNLIQFIVVYRFLNTAFIYFNTWTRE